jgi:uroporphyrin-III C-methyltransferase / precorrin-2 dehydrogenase / sirohydrochlorin ferrochelatase
MSYLPVFLDLCGGPVILTGAGAPARAKLETLRTRGATVTWFPLADVKMPKGVERVRLVRREPMACDLVGAIAFVLASGTQVDDRLALYARERGIPVNAVDRPELSSFHFPAMVSRGEVVVAIGTGGASPVLARRLRERVEAILPEYIGELASFIGRWRTRLGARFGTVGSRALWERFIDGPMGRAVLDGRAGEAEAWLASLSTRAVMDSPLGSVTLVGAGPGDPDLLTLKALHALQDADIVFFDDLVTPEILARARRDATKISVGRRKGKPGPHQEQIHRRMIDAARAGARVVRLKGGDPFIFGRGGEELEALTAAGIPVFAVPGITAAIGAAAEWQIPLTYRGDAAEFAIVTAQRSARDDAIDWARLANAGTTVAIYMGLGEAPSVRDSLIAAGRDPRTPAAVIARATRSDSQAFAGTLAELGALAQKAEGPALLLVGEVVARSRVWRTARALHDARVQEAA